MILSKTVTVILGGKTTKHYENLGYIIPRHINKNDSNRLRVKVGTEIEVRVEDLTPKSTAIIEAICDECGIQRFVKFSNYKSICKRCNGKIIKKRFSGENNPCLKDGHTLVKKKCKTCDNINVRFSNVRCSECVRKAKEEKLKKVYCIDCGIEIKTKKAKRCKYCCNNGKNNPAFNENLTEEDRKLKQKYSLGISRWKRRVVKRDNYTCQCCGFVGRLNDGKLNAHHINNFKDHEELRVDTDNGITLCVSCHKKFHLEYGKRNNNAQQLKEFIDGFFDKKTE